MRHPGIMLLNPESNVLGEANVTPPFRILEDVNAISCRHPAENWLRGLDLNQRPSGYEPDELPGCSTPRVENSFDVDSLQIENPDAHELAFALAASRDFVDV